MCDWGVPACRQHSYDSSMFALLRHSPGWLIGVCCSRHDVLLENLALRQQPLALYGKRPLPRLGCLDKLFWVALRNL